MTRNGADTALRQPGPFIVRRPVLSLVLLAGTLSLFIDRLREMSAAQDAAAQPTVQAFLTAGLWAPGGAALGACAAALLFAALLPAGRGWRIAGLVLAAGGGVTAGLVQGALAPGMLVGLGGAGLVLLSPWLGRACLAIAAALLVPVFAALAVLSAMAGVIGAGSIGAGSAGTGQVTLSLAVVLGLGTAFALVCAQMMLRHLAAGDGPRLAAAQVGGRLAPPVMLIVLAALAVSLVRALAGTGEAAPVSWSVLPVAATVMGATMLVGATVLLSFLPARARLARGLEAVTARRDAAAGAMSRRLPPPVALAGLASAGLVSLAMPLALLARWETVSAAHWLGLALPVLFAVIVFAGVVILTASFRTALLVAVPLLLSCLIVNGLAMLTGPADPAAAAGRLREAMATGPVLLLAVVMLLHAAAEWRQAVAAGGRGAALLAATLSGAGAALAGALCLFAILSGAMALLAGGGPAPALPLGAPAGALGALVLSLVLFAYLSVVLRRLIWHWERQPVRL